MLHIFGEGREVSLTLPLVPPKYGPAQFHDNGYEELLSVYFPKKSPKKSSSFPRQKTSCHGTAPLASPDWVMAPLHGGFDSHIDLCDARESLVLNPVM